MAVAAIMASGNFIFFFCLSLIAVSLITEFIPAVPSVFSLGTTNEIQSPDWNAQFGTNQVRYNYSIALSTNIDEHPFRG